MKNLVCQFMNHMSVRCDDAEPRAWGLVPDPVKHVKLSRLPVWLRVPGWAKGRQPYAVGTVCLMTSPTNEVLFIK